jgi:hypothetical protein
MKHLAAVVVLFLFAAPVLGRQSDKRAEELSRERGKLQREKDPVDRTKIDIKISEILLAYVGDSIQSGDFIKMQEHLTEYSAAIEDAHQSLMGSGRDAQRKAGGFKELEIALRKHVLRFDDLARTLTLDRRGDLERAKHLATSIRDGLLKVLFP